MEGRRNARRQLCIASEMLELRYTRPISDREFPTFHIRTSSSTENNTTLWYALGCLHGSKLIATSLLNRLLAYLSPAFFLAGANFQCCSCMLCFPAGGKKGRSSCCGGRVHCAGVVSNRSSGVSDKPTTIAPMWRLSRGPRLLQPETSKLS